MDRLARQPGTVWARAHAVINLGRDDDFLAAREIADRAAEYLLALAERVAVGGIEEIDAGLDGAPEERAAFFLAQRPLMKTAIAAAVAHAAEAEARDVEAGAAELGVLHRGFLPAGR